MIRRRLPPLTSLRAFEAAARRASFRTAAEELLVTPTAISHHIRQLETFLGFRVLDRTPRAVTLTARGKLLHDATACGFGEIERVVARLVDNDAPETVTLSSTAAFLGHWLIPRLEALRATVPGIDLRLHTSDAVEPLQPGGIDVAIRYGTGPYSGVDHVTLCTDALTPVCSPALALSSPADLHGATLLHIEGRKRPRPDANWARWAALAGVTRLDIDAGPRFPDSMLAVQAAIAGQGVVLVSRILAADALATGVLIAPFPHSLAGDAYHFACATGLEGRSDIAALRTWFEAHLALSAGLG